MEAGTIAPADLQARIAAQAASRYLQWRPGLLPRLTLAYQAYIGRNRLPAMEAGTIAPADEQETVGMKNRDVPAMEAGTIAPADDIGRCCQPPVARSLQWRPGLLPRLTTLQTRPAWPRGSLQWRPGLLPRLTTLIVPEKFGVSPLQWRPGLLPRLTF